MEAKSKWLTEDGNIIAPNTMDSCVFGSDGKSLNEKIPFKFGIDENGKYGYFKTNEEMVTPFGTGDGGDLIIFDQNYSTEEQLTSKRWIDGKPIYQKSFDEQVNSSASEWVSNGDFSGLNIDNFIKIVGTVEYTDGKIFPINSGYLSMAYNPSTKSMVVTQTSMGSNYTWNVKYTILYTKTTDTADSPVRTFNSLAIPDMSYSTEEQLTNMRWIDGKPVYEKTIFIENPTNGGYYEHNLPIEKCIIRDVTALRNGKWQTGIYKDFSVWVSDTQCYTIWDTNSTWDTDTISNIYITIQYTKTTDTADSPVAKPTTLHNYSTEEKVVGTWIDGTTAYEKTFTLNNPTNGLVLVENVNHLITQTGHWVQVSNPSEEQLFPREYSPTVNAMLGVKNNNLTLHIKGIEILSCAIIAQYTKTTDTPTI